MSARHCTGAVGSDILQRIYEKVPCRNSQIKTLLSLFGQGRQPSLPGIFLYGHTSTGKSTVLKALLDELQVQHIHLDCVECFTSRLLYEAALNALAQSTPSAHNDYVTSIKCENINDFVRLLATEVREQKLQEKAIYLVLHRAERLRDMDVNLLPALLRLQELSGVNVTVILESEIVWEKFRQGTGYREPLVLHFPDYSKEELMEILCVDSPSGYDEGFYKTYLNLLLSVFHTACRNLTELRHLAQLNFKKYMEPVESGEADVNDTRKLWKNIEPHLKKALQTVYLREVSSAQWEKYQEESEEQCTLPGVTGRACVELPFYSKFILIAAYLASYNPPKTDKRFFSKHKARISKRTNLADRKKSERLCQYWKGDIDFYHYVAARRFQGDMYSEDVQASHQRHLTSAQLLGPKPFPMDRLMAIFYSIVNDRVAPTANIFVQITSLVSLGLMSQITISDPLEAPKYKCLVSLDFAKSIGRTVNFDMMHHLYDFV